MTIVTRDNGTITYDNQPTILYYRQDDEYEPYFPIEKGNGVTFNTNTLRLTKGSYNTHIDLQATNVTDAMTEIESKISLGGRTFAEISYEVPEGYVYADAVYYKGTYLLLYYNTTINSSIIAKSTNGIAFATANTIENVLYGSICIFNDVVYLLGYASSDAKVYIGKLTDTTTCSVTLFYSAAYSNVDTTYSYLISNQHFMCAVFKYDNYSGSLWFNYDGDNPFYISGTQSPSGAVVESKPQFIGKNTVCWIGSSSPNLLSYLTMDYDGTTYSLKEAQFSPTDGSYVLSNYDPLNCCLYLVSDSTVYKIIGVGNETEITRGTDKVYPNYDFIYCNGRYIYNTYDSSSNTIRCIYGQNPYNNTTPTNGQYVGEQAMKKFYIGFDKLYAVGANDGKVYYSLIR
jgi:hypothetical protein